MTCILCNRTALYVAAGVGYCKDHKAEAIEATAQEKRLIMSRVAVRQEQDRPQPEGTAGTWQGWTFSKSLKNFSGGSK